MSEEFDYIVVGAGSAGCVIALRLAEAGRTVCLLEAGPKDTSPYIHIPAGYVKNIFSKKITWGFMSEEIPGAKNRRLSLVQGKVLGGSSSINGMVYGRGQAADFDGWAQRGNPGWSYEDVLPFFRKSEMRLGEADPQYHGRDGRLTVSDPVSVSPLCDLFIEAAKQVGVRHVPDHNGPRQDGVGPWQFTIDNRGPFTRRMSSARAFLRPALKTGKVSLRTNSPTTGIVLQDGRAIGVKYRNGGPGGPIIDVKARYEVIVSSGAINTPRLLQISGIGPSDLLRSIGVDVAAHLPGVGSNLVDHYSLRIAARVRDVATVNERARGLPLAWEIAKWTMGRPSILSMGPVPIRLFFRSDPALDNPDLQISFTPGSYQEGLPGLLDHYPGMTLGGHKQRPDSRGYVRAVSKDIDVQPVIQPNYLDTESDRAATIEVVKMARRVFGAPAFAPHYVKEVLPGEAVRSDDEILDFARQYGGTNYHHMGTARMGPASDPSAVVDHCLRVHGISGLRVADASIMPTPISGPSNASAIMIGEKAADLILNNR